tara:strand:- start:208 stop:345 length:138 start_codon:yes stop_codon:yes gene_type:complete
MDLNQIEVAEKLVTLIVENQVFSICVISIIAICFVVWCVTSKERG